MAADYYSPDEYESEIDTIKAIDSANSELHIINTNDLEGIDGVDFSNAADPNQIKRNILQLKWHKPSTATPAPPKRDFLITGLLHSREWVANVFVIEIARFLIQHKDDATWPADPGFQTQYFQNNLTQVNPKIISDNLNFTFIPMVNPQGYQYSFKIDASKILGGWRKNRRDVTPDPIDPTVAPPVPATQTGVDLNRNFKMSNWAITQLPNGSAVGTSRSKKSDSYCGKPAIAWNGNPAVSPPGGPSVEIETGAVALDFTNTNYVGHIDVHASGPSVGWAENLDTNQNNYDITEDDKSFHRSKAMLAGKNMVNPSDSKEYGAIESPYPTSGGIQEAHYELAKPRGVGHLPVVFLIETARAFRPANSSAYPKNAMPGVMILIMSSIDQHFSNRPRLQRQPTP